MTEYETARITITRVITEDGHDQTYVETSADIALVEALGLLRMAEDTLIQNPPADSEDDDA